MRGGKLEVSNDGVPMRDSVKPDRYCLQADLLIPGRGDPIQDGCIVVEGSKITYAGKQDDLNVNDAKLPKTHVKVLMPGMWDCHVHRKSAMVQCTSTHANDVVVMGVKTIDFKEFVDGVHNQALVGARIARDVALLLNAGFTSVREMAGYGLQIAQGIKEGSVIGPNIYSSNKIIVRSARSFLNDTTDTVSERHRGACRCSHSTQAMV